ncbi:MAG: META domain-containing protein [Armatimonadetes bacterium]|nr:META domain-containing protein [Armatimonadota bacterium]
MSIVLPLIATAVFLQSPMEGSFSGTVTYRSRMALPTGSVLVVALDRFAGPDHSNVTEVRMNLGGKQVPVAFALPYTGLKTQGTRYGVRAEIRHEGRVLFSSPSTRSVQPGQKSKIGLVLVPAAQADTPKIVDTHWELMALDGKPIGSPERPPTLALSRDGKLQGFGGVNRFGGSYVLGERSAQFDPGPMTLMAGPPELMDTESAFVRILPLANRAEVFEGELVLLRGERELARFRKSKGAG